MSKTEYFGHLRQHREVADVATKRLRMEVEGNERKDNTFEQEISNDGEQEMQQVLSGVDVAREFVNEEGVNLYQKEATVEVQEEDGNRKNKAAYHEAPLFWAKQTNVILTQFLLKMKERNIADVDISMVLMEIEKILVFAIGKFMSDEDVEVAMELIFDGLTTKYYRDKLLTVCVPYMLKLCLILQLKYFHRIYHQ